MITSNINELQFLANIKNDKQNNENSDFLHEVQNNKNHLNTTKTDSLTFNNIKGINLEEIELLFKTEEDKNMAKNLRLATLFSEDDSLSKAMFNTVLGKPFNLGYSFLSDRYEDKHNYFSSFNGNKSLSDLLHDTFKKRNETSELKPTDQVPQDYLDEVLLQINSFSFLDSMRSTSKDQYDKYKDDDSYSFLYNDYNLKYQELVYKYEEIENKNRNLLKQF